ncbi:Malonyl-(acyl-carrier protein) O-methyltransferase [Gammaproteobacteria bacterium]
MSIHRLLPLEGFLPDKTRVRASFERVAAHYEEAAFLQREVGNRLIERLDEVRLSPTRILDLGSGPGAGTRALAQKYPDAHIIAVDLAAAMLREARKIDDKPDFVCADIELLPFSNECVDLVHSNLTLQWCLDLAKTCTEARRVLRPEGLFTFTTFGPDTLRELRTAWQSIEDGHAHVNAFIDMHDIGDFLARAGFSGIVMDMEHITVTYPDIFGLMRDLKQLGAHNVTQGRPRHLTGRKTFQKLAAAYEGFRHEGRLPATYEVIYGHGWASPSVCKEPRNHSKCNH